MTLPLIFSTRSGALAGIRKSRSPKKMDPFMPGCWDCIPGLGIRLRSLKIRKAFGQSNFSGDGLAQKGKAPQPGAGEPFAIRFRTLYFFLVFFVPLPCLVSFLVPPQGVRVLQPFRAIGLTSYRGKIVKAHISRSVKQTLAV